MLFSIIIGIDYISSDIAHAIQISFYFVEPRKKKIEKKDRYQRVQYGTTSRNTKSVNCASSVLSISLQHTKRRDRINCET